MNVMQDRKLPKKILIALIIIVALGSLVYEIITLNGPTKKEANLSDYYQAETGKATLIANGNISNVKAIIKNKHAYIKLDIVMEEINSQFYYDESLHKLLCTNDKEVTTLSETDEYEGMPIYYIEEQKEDEEKSVGQRLYVLLDYIVSRTNVTFEQYQSPDRIFVRSQFGVVKTGVAAGSVAVRERGGNSGKVLCNISAGDKLWIIEQEDGWSKVYIGGDYGHTGYVRDEDIENIKQVVEQGPNNNNIEHKTMDKKVCMVWHQVFNDSGVSAFDKLLGSNTKANVISPTWFSVINSKGDIESRANDEYVLKARRKGLQIWALVENFNKGSDIDYSTLFGKSENRKHLVDSLVKEVVEHNIDGINIDFEGLPKDSGYGYLQFIRELGIECKNKDIVLSVDCYVPSAWTNHYHRQALSEVADYIVIMAYDEHYEGSDAGSTASLSFVENGIADTINEGVPKEQIIVGIPFYSRLWKGEGVKISSQTISMDEMEAYKRKHSYTWDETTNQNYCEYKDGGTLTRIWIEDEKSLSAKLETIRGFGVAGISGWKLGMDNDTAWNTIRNFIVN